MPDINHKQRFFGGLTSDTHPRQIAEGDYVYMLNMRNTKVEGNQFGGAVNVKGNTKLDFALRAGTNFCVGSVEDKQKQRVYYWVHNSLGNHQMLCYDVVQNVIYEVITGDVLKLNREWLITQASIVDGKYIQWGETKVDGMSVEGNAPRYVDAERAVLRQKLCEFDIIVGSADFNANTTSYSLTVNTPTGQFVISLITGAASNGAIANDKADLYRRLKEAINARASNLLTADDCGGCKLEIRSKVEGDVWVKVLSTAETFYTLPRNRYHKDIDETSIKLGRVVPVCPPKVKLIQDADFNQNLIEDKYFQFAVRYVYWDGQKSTFGAFSEIAGFQQSCSTDTSPFNAIEVDFSNEILFDEVRLADIKYVEISVREGNAGSFRSVTKIDVCDLEYPSLKFLFRNDGAYDLISDEEAYRAANQIPLLATTHIVVDDRAWWGGTLERYDNLDCLDANVKVDYGEDVSTCVEEFVTIKGRVRILNYIDKEISSIPGGGTGFVWTDGQKTYYSKGFTTGLTGRTPSEIAEKSGQTLVDGGFYVYLAGTKYFAKTRQIAPTESGISTDQNGAYILGSLNPIANMISKNGIWSEFEIKNVPKGGRYIVRIASNLCCETDENGELYNVNRGLDWQRTSTTLNEVKNNTSTFEIIVNTNVPGDTIDISDKEFIVEDITSATSNFTAIKAYIFDPITDHSGNIDAIRAGVNIESSVISTSTKNRKQISGTRYGIADHNGFVYVTVRTERAGVNNNYAFFLVQAKIDKVMCDTEEVMVSGQQVYKGTLQQLISNSGLIATTSAESQSENDLVVTDFIIYNHNKLVTTGKSFIANGSIVDSNGIGIPNVKNAISGTNRVAVTDIWGRFSVRLYVNIQGASNTVQTSNIVVENKCCLDFTRRFDLIVAVGVSPTDKGGSFNSESPYTIPDNIAIIKQGISGIWKRRNRVRTGIKYYDKYNRSSKVQTADSMSAYIPFWTEDGASKGLVSVGYEVRHTPPIWAERYQVVRTLNPIYSRYLQYIIGQPRYVRTFADNISDTSYGARDATEVYIPLQSLVDYSNENSGSVLAWDFLPNDRVTFMKDDAGNWFNGFFDFRIENDRVSPDDATYLVIKFDQNQPELKPGAMLELYSLKANPEKEFFYEITECYPILDAGTPNRRHGAGNGGQAQTATQPATGWLKYGDAYLQTRSMPLITDDINTRIRTIFESEYMNENVVESRVQSIGRFDIEDKDYKQIFYYTRQRITGRYLPDTAINGLNQFIENDYLKDENGTEIDRRFGVAISTQFAGTNVLAIHQFKCQPIYTNATPVYDLQGQSVLTKSRSIATIAQPIREDKGSQNPESIYQENGNVYGFDRQKNSWWRYGFNGLFDISDYEMASFFDRIAARLDAVADKRVISMYDRQKDEFIVSYPGLGETIAFNEMLAGDTPKNRWMTYYSFIPDTMGVFGEKLISWKNGELWLHDTNEQRTSFYGVVWGCGVDFYANIAPEVKKILKNIRIKSNGKFITAPRGIQMFDGEGQVVMVSELRNDHVQEYEGDWWADVLRDMDDKEFADIQNPQLRSATALLKGRVLRGDYALIKLRNYSTDIVTLWSVDVTSVVSQKTKE